jgi:hypothetical protein
MQLAQLLPSLLDTQHNFLMRMTLLQLQQR